MPDREKVIEALENADVTDGIIKMSTQFRDVLVSLLKEQEPMEPITDKLRNYVCPVCGDRLRGGKFCMNCGQAVKLE